MLIDDVTITIKAGNGGDGSASFKRSAQTPKGGPDGGNGGNGGDVYFQGINDITALRQFQFKKEIKAEDGIPGKKKNLFGRNGKNIIIKVSIGTTITDLTNGEEYEIQDESNLVLLAKGGKGGRGNREFRSALNQAPKYAEKGTPGEEKEIRLELKLIADVGFVGLPNAGKSSLLKVLTNAEPKIANYPFTTLEPNLGVMGGIVLADIPGLIEGAHTGKGLGIKFLKHIEKTRLLVHCVDSTLDNPLNAYKTVKNELSSYNKELESKVEIILLTKIDLLTENEIIEKLKRFEKANKKVIPFTIMDEKKIEEINNLIKSALKS